MHICVGGPKDGEYISTDKSYFSIININPGQFCNYHRDPYEMLQTTQTTYELQTFGADRDRYKVWVPIGQTPSETMAILIHNYSGKISDKSNRKRNRL